MAEAPTTKERREQLRESVQSKLAPAVLPPSPIDGRARSPDDEARLNELFALVFRGGRGKEALEYLHGLTFGTIAGPGIHPDQLMHLEGSRYLFGIIQARIEIGRRK